MEQTRRDVMITSAAITKEVFLKGAYTERLGKTGEQKHTYSSNVSVHADLRIAFNKLTQHVIALADLHDANGLLKEEKVTVIGFTVSGDGEAEGITISATRELDNLKLVAINTPFQSWDDQVAPYELASELSMIIEECKAEVYSYLFEDKHQPDLQGDLFASNANGQNEI